ncbi:MAG: hypothetical protein KF690_12345, partial [Bacteroidetes bacterium]|nr:hypothetical protein [Bacteroidota bacterium]
FLLWVNLLAMAVTLWHKTSLHVIAPAALWVFIAGRNDRIWSLDMPWQEVVMLCIPILIAIARYREGAHTRGQLASAFAIGLLAGVSFYGLQIYLWIP